MRCRPHPLGPALLGALALGAAPPSAIVDRQPTPPPGLGLDAASCGECHAELVARWRTSRHAVAATNAVFTASWEHWPNGWCLSCHAPRIDAQVARLGVPAVPGAIHRLPDTAPGPAWADGVDCATCHVRDGAVVSGREPSAAAVSAHPVTVDPRLRTGALCATCHEFPIQRHTPPAPFAYGETPAQETWTEWSGSRAAAEGVGCVDCHLEGHTFPGAHTPAMVTDLVQAQVTRDADVVVARIAAPGAAHRVPTGDPFRRLELRLYADDALGDPVARVTLRRVFAADDTSWVLVADRTIPPDGPGEPVRELRIDAPTATAWQLWYGYGDPAFEALLPPSEVGFEIARGRVE